MLSIYEKILDFKKRGIPSIVVTAVKKQDAGPVEVGKKMIVAITGEAFGTVGGGAIEYYAREKCKTLLLSRENLLEEYLLSEGEVLPNTKTLPMVCGGVVTLFYEYIGSKEMIYIFGAGHVSQALVNILKTMDYHVTVIDERKNVIDSFLQADIRINMPFVEYIEQNPIPDDSFIVVCTPSHKHDYHVINKVIELNIKPKYMGMLCSPDKLKDYLEKTYDLFGKDVDLSHFYSPIGLDLGGGSPEEIAISITSEILAVSNHKTGHKHLREAIDGKDCYWKD
ncbi:MAG: XdhC/CoxI family protein [Firmicutes bacterium]|nr:XdhC/CoxI family protein [Bacillota bacterium]